ncbi:hypothetical protein E2C01_082690 [Portunus trituberculatus]|uniref:Uncharacterized protein n=1 Tax=Portunus trituberculatus TaxID=210409 RepID=A0A5B7IZY5_PORTR|nr:hypothetical protein [Portunus trituberculatus]
MIRTSQCATTITTTTIPTATTSSHWAAYFITSPDTQRQESPYIFKIFSMQNHATPRPLFWCALASRCRGRQGGRGVEAGSVRRSTRLTTSSILFCHQRPGKHNGG